MSPKGTMLSEIKLAQNACTEGPLAAKLRKEHKAVVA